MIYHNKVLQKTHTGGKKVISNSLPTKVKLGATIRLLSYDLEITGLNLGNNFSVCRGKVAYIYPP